MANLFHSDIYDHGLEVLSSSTNTVLHLCSPQPMQLSDLDGCTLGHKDNPLIGAPEARLPNGREVTIAAITEGAVVTATGDSAFWALADETRLLVSAELNGIKHLTVGTEFTTSAFSIGIPAPTHP